MYFVINKGPYFSVSMPGPQLPFVCTASNYVYKMTKYIENVPEVQNIQ